MPAEEEKPVHEIDHGVARRLFKEYVQAKKAAGQSTKGLSYGKMLAKLSAEAGRLKEQLGAHVEVKFQVKTIDGKVRLRALKDKSETKGKSLAASPPKPAAPKVAPPPIPGAKGSSAKPPKVAPPPIPPKVAPPQKPLDETDEELGVADLHHDDLDEMEEVDESELTTPEDDSIRSTLAALMEEENEPLPASVAGNEADLTASQKVSFATLGDIAKRMDELAERKEAPAKAAKAAKDRAVLEGESSGEADIRSVAESIKKKMAPEAGAPSDEVEGDSIPISLTDEDDVAAVGGFGTAAAVSLAENKPIVSTEDADEDDEDDEAPTRAFRPGDLPGDAATQPEKSGGFPVGVLLLLIIVVAGGVGYVMYGDQLLGGSGVASQAPEPAPGPAPNLEPGPMNDEIPAAQMDDGAERPLDETAETGEAQEPAEAAPAEDAPKKKRGKRAASDASATKQPAPDDAGQEPAEDAPEQPAPAEDGAKKVDCLLNPDAPGCRKEPKVVEEKPKAPELPAKLSQNQLRDGFQKVKADAKLCGKHHGVESGTKVSVKVSIQGKTGGITKASPRDEHAGTALGKCVAEALQRASFPQFSSPTMGVTWTIRM